MYKKMDDITLLIIGGILFNLYLMTDNPFFEFFSIFFMLISLINIIGYGVDEQ